MQHKTVDEAKSLEIRDLSILKKLVEVDGTSGSEDEVRGLMRNELEPIVTKIQVDKIGNLVAFYSTRKSEPLTMLVSHMDEVGLMIKWIRPDGNINFDLSGLIDPAILPSQWVRIHTRKGIVRGVIGVRAGHFADEVKSEPSQRSLWIDVGATSREEVLELGIRQGDFVTFDRSLGHTNNGRYLYGKALDNRVGCAVMIEVAKELRGRNIECNAAMVGTVMEELGALGANVVANSLNPDTAIVIDGIPASDPIVKPEQSAVFVGEGPVITKFESSIPRANVTPKWLLDLATDVAEDNRIPYQIDVNSVFYSDASSICIAGGGIPTIPISVARRNSHSPAEIVSTLDIEYAIRLVVKLVECLGQGKSDGGRSSTKP